MDFQKLQIFYTVATLNNISAASEQLHMSRQNISKVLRNLEESLNCQLLVRTSSGVRLTEKGLIFLEYIAQIRTLSADLQSKLSQVDQISYSLLVCYQLQESINELLSANFEDSIALNLFNSDANYINRCIWHTPQDLLTYDLVLSCGDGKPPHSLPSLPNYHAYELLRQPIGIIISSQHPLNERYAPEESIAPHDLPSYPLIAMTNKLGRTPIQVQLMQNHYPDLTVSRLTNDLRLFKDGLLSSKYYGFSDLFGFHTLFDPSKAQWHPLTGDPTFLSYFCLIHQGVRQTFREIFLSKLDNYISSVVNLEHN